MKKKEFASLVGVTPQWLSKKLHDDQPLYIELARRCSEVTGRPISTFLGKKEKARAAIERYCRQNDGVPA